MGAGGTEERLRGATGECTAHPERIVGQEAKRPTTPSTFTSCGRGELAPAIAEPRVPDVHTPLRPRSFLESRCGPGMDLRRLAEDLSDVDWGEIERWLPPEFRDLKYAATARTFKNLRVKLSEVLAHLQTVQAALFITDTAAAQKMEDGSAAGAATNERWSWSDVHVDATREKRYFVLAWHMVAVRWDELMLRWGVTDRDKATYASELLRNRMGFSLVESGMGLPPIQDEGVNGARHSRTRDGKILLQTRVNLAGYQRRAAAALPAEVGLHRALTGYLVGVKDGHASCWLRDPEGGSGVCQIYELPDWEGRTSAGIYVRAGKVVALFEPRGIVHEREKRQSGSNWIHPAINWKRTADDMGHERNSGCKQLPLFDVTRVALRANTWIERIPDLGMAARTILEGKLSLPMTNDDIPAMDARNHDTCNDNPGVIDAIVAEYLIMGVLEFCPPGHPPRCISALGLVPKKTAPFFRLIVDLRPVNRHMAEWRTHMAGIAANAMMFNPGAVAFSRDLKAAYLLSALGGCEPGLHGGKRFKNDDKHTRMKAPGERRTWIGCTPETCLGHCNKSMLGVRWREHLFRYAAPCFGSKHGGNVLETLLAPVLRKLKGFGCNVTSWVDDIICVIENRGGKDHDPMTCGGELGCEHCADTFRRAREVEKLVDEEFDKLGLLTSDKNAPPAQSGEFLGLWWDTVQGAFKLQPDKARTLAQGAQELLDAESVTPRACAEWRGKMQWYAVCIEGVRILTRHVTEWIGAPDGAGWDLKRRLSPEARAEFDFWARHLPDMAGHPKPMWSTAPGELLRQFKKGHRSVGACLSVDASIHGWGAILETREEDGSTARSETSGRWGTADEVGDQAHREAYGTLRAFETFMPQLQGRLVLHLTDCSPVEAAVNKGSKSSIVLQKVAVALWKLSARWSAHIVSHWIAGTTMVDTGVDRLSREDAIDKHDVRVTEEGWRRAQALADEGGIQLTVDWFADPHNARRERFWSRQIAIGAAGTDAFTACSWGRQWCGDCQKEHDYGAWIFPPVPLIPKVIGKLKADRAHGVALLPYRPDTTWWTVMAQACQGGTAVVEIPVDEALDTTALTEHSLMYTNVNWRLCRFDFGADRPLCYDVQCKAASPWARPAASPAELGHQRRLHAMMFRLDPDLAPCLENDVGVHGS